VNRSPSQPTETSHWARCARPGLAEASPVSRFFAPCGVESYSEEALQYREYAYLTSWRLLLKCLGLKSEHAIEH
jgi:hypothetical protein